MERLLKDVVPQHLPSKAPPLNVMRPQQDNRYGLAGKDVRWRPNFSCLFYRLL